jgi:hypothetical protein
MRHAAVVNSPEVNVGTFYEPDPLGDINLNEFTKGILPFVDGDITPIARLAQFLTSWEATTFLVGEYVQEEISDNVIFTMVDYVPGCRPHCGQVKSYRNWTGEVMSHGSFYNLEGTTYNPQFDPVKGDPAPKP